MADQVTDLTYRNDNFTFLLIDSYSESSHVAHQVADLTPLEMVVLDSYYESSHLADQVTDLPPRNGDFRFLLIDSYS